MKIGKFFASPLGSLIKAFLATVLTLWFVDVQNGKDMWSMDLVMVKKLIAGGLAAIIPVVINWLNPQYKNYGK